MAARLSRRIGEVEGWEYAIAVAWSGVLSEIEIPRCLPGSQSFLIAATETLAG